MPPRVALRHWRNRIVIGSWTVVTGYHCPGINQPTAKFRRKSLPDLLPNGGNPVENPRIARDS